MNSGEKGEREEQSGPGISGKGKTNKEETVCQFQQERNRTQLEKELGRAEGSQEMIAGSKTMEKKAGALSPQKDCYAGIHRTGKDKIEGGGRGKEEFQDPLRGKSKENELGRPSLDGIGIGRSLPA